MGRRVELGRVVCVELVAACVHGLVFQLEVQVGEIEGDGEE